MARCGGRCSPARLPTFQFALSGLARYGVCRSRGGGNVQAISVVSVFPESERRIEGRVTYVYHLFPNALVTVLSHHTILVVLEPIAPGRTRNIAYSLAHTGGDPAAAEAAKRDTQFVTQTGAPEDRALAESIQRTMESGANEHFTFGHFESAIVHFHRNLDAALAELDRGA